MQTREVVLRNPNGLHLRLAGALVRLVLRHGVRATLSSGTNRRADGRSILSLLMLQAGPGARLQINVEGPEEVRAASKLEELLTDGAGI